MVDQQNSFSSCSRASSISRDETEAEEGRPSAFLAQCFQAFALWYYCLRSRDVRGNIIVIPEIDYGKGVVRIARTEFAQQDRSTTVRGAYVGFTGTLSHLIHGSVVAIYCDESKSFLEMNGSLVYPKECTSSEKLPRDAITYLFLVIDLGYGYIAFYNMETGRFLGVSTDLDVYGISSTADLNEDGLGDEDTMEEIPNDALFVVRPERSDGSLVSFFSL
jgi:hypothetical protein